GTRTRNRSWTWIRPSQPDTPADKKAGGIAALPPPVSTGSGSKGPSQFPSCGRTDPLRISETGMPLAASGTITSRTRRRGSPLPEDDALQVVALGHGQQHRVIASLHPL